MGLFDKFKSQERRFKEFEEKTGIQLTDEPIYRSDWEREGHLEGLSFMARKQPRKAIPILEKAMQEHPEIPAIKNYLHIAYAMAGQSTKARAILDKTLKEHPKYVFGITTKLLNIQDEKEIERNIHLLGNPRDIRELEGYDNPIHISAFKNYQTAAAYCEMMLGEDRTAVERFETLMELDVEKEFLDSTAKLLARVRFLNMTSRMSKMGEGRISVKSIQKVHLEQTEKAPDLNHEELLVFYEKSIETISKKEVEKIMELPRASLISDLECIVEDSMKRYNYFEEEDYEESRYEFIIHALYFLGALKAEESLPKVLDLLRMGEGFTDLWFGDMSESFLYPTLYALGERQLASIKAYVLEDNLFAFDRIMASYVVSQVALHQPDRREEVLQWYESVFQHLLANPKNNKLIDSDFIGFCVGNLIDIRGKELIPIIEQLYEKGWIQDSIQGDIAEILKLIQQEPHPSELKPLPVNIHEYYSKIYKERKVKCPPLPPAEKEKVDFLMNNKAEQYIMDHMMSFFMKPADTPSMSMDVYEEETPYTTYEPVQTIVRKEPKVGRNAPCPCGSGKKYKRCCMRK